MAKRSLTEESCNDFRDKKRIRISLAESTSHGFNDFCFSGDDDDEYEQEDCESSVGSNHPIFDVILISDSEDDEVESPSSKIDISSHEDITGDEDTQTGITLFRSPAVAENQCGEIEVTEKKQKEGEEEEAGNWWVEFGSMIVDNNGFLLGEYRRLDEELYVNITADS
ncbi:unnamed protein product [Lactuca virosa]|uniref:Uncharacterized protein n=1 Tax=Lactuca virosa TaxID=75947 RepID=A0AAU9M4G0_9ASTR|nr:unnamed protein product [Lactuca virosa]